MAVATGSFFKHPSWGLCRVNAIEQDHARVVLERGGEKVLACTWITGHCVEIPASAINPKSRLLKPSKPSPSSRRRTEVRWRVVEKGGMCTRCHRSHIPLYVPVGSDLHMALCRYCRAPRNDSISRDALDHADFG